MPSALPGSFGALLLGTWVNAILYTLELYQVRYFFNNYKDSFIIRSAVLGAMVVDTVCAAASCACIYLYTITNWGNEPYLAAQYWPVPLYICTTGVTAAIVQAFLIYRIWVLSTNRPITLGLVLLATTAFVSSVLTTIGLIRFPAFVQRENLRVPATAWFASSAVSDIAIALALVYLLRSMNSSFKSTESLVQRLMASALKTGTATAGIATLILALYLQDAQSNIATGFAFTMGRIYSLTMLFNLNTRQHGRHTENSEGMTSSEARQAPISLSGIQVSRTVHVNEDIRQSGALRRTDNVVEVDDKSVDDEYYDPNKTAPFASV